MSAGDPYYRPNFKAQNPFATLKRFKVRSIRISVITNNNNGNSMMRMGLFRSGLKGVVIQGICRLQDPFLVLLPFGFVGVHCRNPEMAFECL